MTPASPPEMLATCWTTAGNVMPLRTGDHSPIPLGRRIAAARRAGYTGFGLGAADLVTARDALGWEKMSDLFRESGITHIELEFLDNWWAEGAPRAASDKMRADLLEAAARLGARHIKVGVGDVGQTADADVLRSEFANLAAEAEEAGVKIALEATAFSILPNLNLAVDLVQEAGHPNGGLLVDIWHVYRSGMDYQTMAAILPAQKVFAVEINDGARRVAGTMYEDTFDNRILPGEGEFGVAGFIRALRALGYNGPWGVEMMSLHHRTLSPETAALEAFKAAERCLLNA